MSVQFCTRVWSKVIRRVTHEHASVTWETLLKSTLAMAPIWGCLLAARDRLYVGNTDGVMTVLRLGRRKKELVRIEMGAPLHSRPTPAGDTLFLATANRL